MSFIKRITGAAALGGALMLGAGLLASPAEAGYVVTLQETGGNVVANGSGRIDLTGLTFYFSNTVGGFIEPDVGIIVTGGVGTVNNYTGITGPTDFGFADFSIPTSSSGDTVVLNGLQSFLGVPSGYVSNTPLSDTATYFGRDFNSLGVTPGTYEWTWGEGANQNFTLIIGTPVAVPEPGSAALLGTALAALLLAGAIRRRRSEP